jgi:hypothetical protein
MQEKLLPLLVPSITKPFLMFSGAKVLKTSGITVMYRDYLPKHLLNQAAMLMDAYVLLFFMG